jgi:hypothetical protein
MKKFIYTLTILCVYLFTQTSVAANEEAYLKTPFLKPYEMLLNKHIHAYAKKNIQGTGVNYLEWQKDPLHNEAMALLESTDLSKLSSREEKISFWINAYNLLSIDLIVKSGEQDSVQNLGGLVGDPWNEFSWVIGDLETTLSQMHHQTLRSIGEPRVHFALTCAALSCPDLKPEPYWPELIYTQLERQTRNFLRNSQKGMKLIKSEKTSSRNQKVNKFKVSKIFQSFKNDFDHGDIIQFVQRYAFLYGAEFDGYMLDNWELNALEGKKPLPVSQ